MLYRYLLILFFFVDFFINSFSTKAQILDTSPTFPQLNSGGVMYDVAYDSINGVYFIVGDFTSVNGVARNNLAALNSSTHNFNSSSTYNIISSIDGPIRSVAVFNNFLFIAGDFTQINSNQRWGLALFQRSGSTYVLHTWNPINSTCGTGNEKINCLEIFGDTLLIGGKFELMRMGLSCYARNGLAGFKLPSLTLMPFGSLDSYSDYAEIYAIDKYGSSIYAGGYNFEITDNAFNTTTGYTSALIKLDINGLIDPSFNPSWTIGGGDHIVYDLAVSKDGIFAVYGAHIGTPELGRFDAVTGTKFPWLNTEHPSTSPIFNTPHSIEFYNDKIYFGNINSATSPQFGGRKITNQYPMWNSGIAVPFNNGSVKRLGNKLFVSENNLTSIGAVPRSGLAIYCLEPYRPTEFTVFDTTICPNQQNVIFTVPLVPYASQYHWFYSGNGININGNGSDYIFNGANYNTVSIDFLSDFTPGTLYMVPMSYCGERTDTLSINIYANPVPNIDAGVDTNLTCKFPEIWLTGSSATPNVNFNWTGPFSLSENNDSIYISNSGEYIFSVTDPLYGCTLFDTLNVVYDTAQPNVSAPIGPHILTCSDTLVELFGSSLTTSTILEWRNVTNGFLFPNPIQVSDPGQYTLIVTDTLNGCKDSTTILVTTYQPVPNIAFENYPGFISSLPLDTLTCYHLSFSLSCYSDTLNTLIYFTDSSNSQNFGDSILVDSSGIYYVYCINTSTGCSNFLPFYVAEFKNLPDLNLFPFTNLTCTIDTVELNAYSVLPFSQIEWNGVGLLNAPNPVYITNPGAYVVTNTRTDNGCSLSDTIEIGFDSTLNVFVGSDTVVCIGTSISLECNSSDSLILFNWSNGVSTQQCDVIVNNSQIVWVYAENSSGCYGTDTILLSVPEIPNDSIVGFKPCDGDSTGYLVVFLNNGVSPYQYSIDGFNFQSENQFSGLPIGIYDIYVTDSLNCLYTFSAEISNNSGASSPFFLNSTYNFVNDTIAFIDISIPQPDSLQWEFPSSFTVLQNSGSAFVIANDTGTFTVTLIAYYTGCESSISKFVHVLEFDSTIANFKNENGIKTFVVYPNPNSGMFTIDLQFYKAQDYIIKISDALGTMVFNDVQQNEIGKSYSISLPETATNGTYIVTVVSEFDSSNYNFILSR